VAANVPTGVTFHDNGNNTATLSGTLQQQAKFDLTITAQNAVGTVQQTLEITVARPSKTSGPAPVALGLLAGSAWLVDLDPSRRMRRRRRRCGHHAG
jgi:hypothetical protein